MTDLLERLLEGLAVAATWEGIKWAWNHREQISQTLRGPRTIRVTVTDQLGLTDDATSTVTKDLEARWNVRSLVTKDLDLRWNVEAPTPSLARRLEELASWYLHVS